MDNILESIKKLVGADGDDDYDSDILMFINMQFLALGQEGIGDEDFVVDEDTTWSDYSDEPSIISNVRQYVFIKVKLIFDPPQPAYLVDLYTETAKECEWRLMTKKENLTGGTVV